MKDVKYLVIGGGLAAFHAAKQVRRADAEGSVLLVSEEPVAPYDRPPLSKEYLRKEKTLAEITYDTPENLAAQNIELWLGVRITSIDAGAKTAMASNGETIKFDKAFLGTGADVIKPRIPGIELAGIHYLRTAADAEGIAAEARPGTHAVIVGGGFIGVETAASLIKLGAAATVIEALPYIMARACDEQTARFLMDYTGKRGIEYITDEMVSEFQGKDGRVSAAVTKSGKVIPCDFVCVGIGVRPNVELAQSAGLKVEDGIWVDDHMATSNPDIYAAGDVVNYPDPVFGDHRRVQHWGAAEYGGQIAGRNMAGGDMKYDLLNYVWSDIFDLHIEAAGDESDYDQVLLRGEYEDAKFTVIYLKQGMVQGYYAINTDAREYTTLRRLIRARKDLRGREADITNPEFNLRDLL